MGNDDDLARARPAADQRRSHQLDVHERYLFWVPAEDIVSCGEGWSLGAE